MNLSDARVQNTRRSIRHTFLDLLKQKPVNCISVTELCAESGINRTTFYKHYADVFDLLDQMEQEMLENLRQSLVSQEHTSLYDLFLNLFCSIKSSGQNWWVLGSEHGDSALYTKMFAMVYEGNFPRVQQKVMQLSPEVQNLLYHYLAQGCGGVIRYWIKFGTIESPELLASFLTRATNSLMNGFMEDYRSVSSP